MEFLVSNYQWIVAIHVISIICWMAGLFYLPRLFVYHAQNVDNTSFTDIVKIQERKLFAYIMRPAMLLSVITGALLIYINTGIFKGGIWIHIKLLFVCLLLVFHIACGVFVAKLGVDSCKFGEKFFRFFNEIPTILMIVIVVCAVVKF